jgi:phosphoribosylformylglycinamidine cyclo-ligase
VKPILRLLESVRVKGLAHITGGGLTGNVPRVFPAGTKALINKAAWPRPALFQWLQKAGNVAEDEMFRVFNCGIGMVAVVAPGDAKRAADELRACGEIAYEIGTVEKSSGEPEALIV